MTTIDKIEQALADPDAPWYGSDLVSWVGDLLEDYKDVTRGMIRGRGDGGLDADERLCLDHACACWDAWLKLDNRTADDNRTVRDALHHVQDLLTNRVARKHYPDFWK